MERFVAYARSIEPGLLERARGAGPAKLARFSALLGHPLSASHTAYLSLFGEDDGGLALAQPLSTKIDDLIDHCEDPDNELRDDATPFAAGIDEPVWIEDGGRLTMNGEPYAGSIEGLAFRQAFIKYEMAMSATSGIFTASLADAGMKNRLDEARDIATREGWAILDWSDACAIGARREDALLAIHQPGQSGIWLRIASANESSIEALAEPFCRSLGVTFDQWFRGRS